MKINSLKRALTSGFVGLASLLPIGCSNNQPIQNWTVSWYNGFQQSVDLSVYDEDGIDTIEVTGPNGKIKAYDLSSENNPRSFEIRSIFPVDKNGKYSIKIMDTQGNISIKEFTKIGRTINPPIPQCSIN